MFFHCTMCLILELFFRGRACFYFFLFCFFFVVPDHASGVIDFFVLETCIVYWINLCVWPVLQTVIISEPISAPKGDRFPIVFRDTYADVELWRAGLLFVSRIKYWGQQSPEPVWGPVRVTVVMVKDPSHSRCLLFRRKELYAQFQSCS